MAISRNALSMSHVYAQQIHVLARKLEQRHAVKRLDDESMADLSYIQEYARVIEEVLDQEWKARGE